MVLDKEVHRQMLQEIMNKSVFPGEHAELVVELKQAINTAIINGV